MDFAFLTKRIEQIPQLSPTAAQLLRMQSFSNSSLADVARTLSLDASLTAAVLRAANSASARPVQPVVSVTQAVTQVGERMVLAMALAACVPGGMVMPLDSYGGEPGALWRHSVRAAFAARELARRAKPALGVDLAFTAGLLHDIGKPVLSTALGRDVSALLAGIAARRSSDLAFAEQELVGICHAQVGEMLAVRWKLPEPLVAAIRFHHEPARAPAEHLALAFTVQAANAVAMLADESGHEGLRKGAEAAVAGLGMSGTDLDRLLERLLKETVRATEQVAA